MMRQIKTLLLATLLCGFAFTFSSCSDDDKTYAYTAIVGYHITTGPGDTSNDAAKIDDYFASKGCPRGGMFLMSDKSNQREADAQAKAKFDKLTAKLIISEIQALGLKPDTEIYYSLHRDETSDGVQAAEIARWEYIPVQ